MGTNICIVHFVTECYEDFLSDVSDSASNVNRIVEHVFASILSMLGDERNEIKMKKAEGHENFHPFGLFLNSVQI